VDITNIKSCLKSFVFQHLIVANGFYDKQGIFLRTYDTIYLLTAIGLSPGGSNTLHIYTQTIHRTTQSTQTMQ